MKQLFTGDFCAFSDSDRDALRSLIRRVIKSGCRIAEIGCWLGNGSTQVFLEELSACHGSRLLCIDTWRGNPGVKRHSDITDHYDVLSTFRHNTTAYAHQIDIMVSDSLSAAELIKDCAFDLVFIDADHHYDAVVADIAAWRPKVRRGGILCGHDCEMRPTKEIIAANIAAPDKDTIALQNLRFSEIHAGCIVAVDEIFRGKAELFSEMSQSTIWAYAE